jgi:hypothetical protein
LVTPDYRVVLSGKEGKGWRIRFEVRGIGKDGKACIQSGFPVQRIRPDGVIAVIADVFSRTGQGVEALKSEDGMTEVRGGDTNGKAGAQPGFPAQRIGPDGVTAAIADAFSRADQGMDGMTDERRALARRAFESNAKRNAELAAMSPEDREAAIAEWAKKLAGDVAELND